MKSNNLLRCALGLMGISGGLQLANAAETFAFSVPGPGGFVKDYADLSASGTVTFDGTTVTLFIENGDDIDSAISKVYLLKPMVGGSNIDATGVSGVANWSVYNNLDDPNNNGKPGTILKNNPGAFDFDPYDASNYFGAASDSAAARIDRNDSATFTFTMASSTDSVNWGNYLNDQQPTIVIRWQEVGNDGEGSSAGYGWLETGGTVPPVPEPRLIGSLAALGLGGLLLVRRRFTGKARKA